MAQTGPLPPYGEAIQQAVASGDVARMKKVAKDAEAFTAQWGNIPAALEALRLEIAKAEAGGGRTTPTGSGSGGSSSSGGLGGTRKARGADAAPTAKRSAKPKR